MKRGDLWVARADLYASKARPVLIIQSDKVSDYNSIITCLVTSYELADDELRIRIEPTRSNGLETTSYLMLDKIFSFDKNDLTKRIGELSESEMDGVNSALRYILGLE